MLVQESDKLCALITNELQVSEVMVRRKKAEYRMARRRRGRVRRLVTNMDI